MANEDIRKEIESAGISYWQVADALGISDATLAKWLRMEKHDDKKAAVLSAIRKISVQSTVEPKRQVIPTDECVGKKGKKMSNYRKKRIEEMRQKLSDMVGLTETYPELRDVCKEFSRYISDLENEFESSDDKIVVEADRCILVLYPSEIKKLVQYDDNIYEKALKRGKSEARYMANERRQ